MKTLWVYLGLTFALSWLCWSPFYVSKNVPEFFALVGAWCPTLVALGMYAQKRGYAATKRWLGQVLRWRGSVSTYGMALFAVPFVAVCSLGVHRLLGGKMPSLAEVLWGMGLDTGDELLAVALLPLFFLINTAIGGPVAEELGWRGFLQARLQGKYGYALSGVLVGCAWACWHLPLHFFFPQAVAGMPFWAYFPLMIFLSVFLGWVYARSRGSLWPVIILHGSANFTHGFLGKSVFEDLMLLTIHLCLLGIFSTLLILRDE